MVEFKWHDKMGADLHRSLSGIVKNDGYFKSVAQAKVFKPRVDAYHSEIISGDIGDKTIQVGGHIHSARTDYAFMKKEFGVEAKKGQYVLQTSGTAVWAAGNRGHRDVIWAWVMDAQGVVKQYKMGRKEEEHGSSIDKAKTKVLFTRKRIASKELDVGDIDEHVKKRIRDAKALDKQQKESQYIGKVGERSTFELKLKKIRMREVTFGWRSNDAPMYTFEDKKGNFVIWFASRDYDLKKGKTYKVTGTVKSHDQYMGTRQTYLTRCKIVE